MVVLAVVAGGCGLNTSSVGPMDGGDPFDPALVTQPGATSDCDRPSGNFFSFPTLESLEDTLHGTWELCTNQGLFREPQAGLFIANNNHWVLLERVEDRLVPKAPGGGVNSGVLAFYGLEQVNFESEVGTIITSARIGDDPRLFFINNAGTETFVYAFVKP